MKEPLFDRYFVVIANNERIYWGLFTDYASSMSCPNPVIIVWSRTVLDTSFITNSMIIDRSYPPPPENESGSDLRKDSRIFNALLASGILK